MENQSFFANNKKWLVIIIITIILLLADLALYPNKPGKYPFVDIPLLIFTFSLILKFRKPIANKIRRTRIPKFILYIITILPLMIYEENINCLPTGCVPIPPTIPYLMKLCIILGILAWIFRAKKIRTPIILFSLFGILVEFTYGAGAVLLRAMLFSPQAPLAILYMVEIGISYAFFVIIPLTIFIEKEN